MQQNITQIGPATMAGKLYLWTNGGGANRDLIDTFGLLGDPASRLAIPAAATPTPTATSTSTATATNTATKTSTPTATETPTATGPLIPPRRRLRLPRLRLQPLRHRVRDPHAQRHRVRDGDSGTHGYGHGYRDTFRYGD